jgi:hypothetical protein
VSDTAIGPRCETCRFADRTHGGFVECRRHAPWPQTDGTEESRYLHPQPHFPILGPYEWCGDWESLRSKGDTRDAETLLRMVAVHLMNPNLGGLSKDQLIEVKEWYRVNRR